MSPTPPFADPLVAARFENVDQASRAVLLEISSLIFETAAETDGVGPLLETLKWGQPAYLISKSKSGTTIRLDSPTPGNVALYTHCQTSVIADFEALFPDAFRYEANRAVHLSAVQPLPRPQLALLITRALTYHLKGTAARAR
ncbi:MAG: DUF1801 domain-containing protein [Pseudomonadota bacterium]